MTEYHFTRIAIIIAILMASSLLKAQIPVFQFDNNSSTRWTSPENRSGARGAGAKENNGAKGVAYLNIEAGATQTLLDVKAQGVVNRIWITINDRSPKTLRSLVIEMYWDNESKPAVSVPLADFFGMALGRMSTFHNSLFASAEGRSFNSFIQMPFRKAAKIIVRNESEKRLNAIYFDVNYQILQNWNSENLYFHAYWHRDTATALGTDFELLPKVKGKGRLLGVNVGVNANPLYGKLWWGEGEVKVFMDGDKEYPTLVNTGTEDYIGDAWGQGVFFNDYAGCLVADEKKLQWSYYRYHIPDPIYFKQECSMTVHQMGSSFTKEVITAQKNGAPMLPVSVDDGKGNSRNIYQKNIEFDDPSVKEDFALFYRTDDMSATAYFYLDKPKSDLPLLQTLAIRTVNLERKVEETKN